MNLICEIFIKRYLPSLRALITKKLIEKYSLTQTEVAKKLETTQPAVSHYLREARGKFVKKIENDEEILSKIDEMVEMVNAGVDKVQLLKFFCEICKILRRKRFLCEDCGLGENCNLCWSGCIWK